MLFFSSKTFLDLKPFKALLYLNIQRRLGFSRLLDTENFVVKEVN